MTSRAVIRTAKDLVPARTSDPSRSRRNRTLQAERGRGRPSRRRALEAIGSSLPSTFVQDVAEETFDLPSETMWSSEVLDADFDMDADDLLAGATSMHRAVNAEEYAWE